MLDLYAGQPFDKKILEELIEEVDEDSKYKSISQSIDRSLYI